VTLFVLGAISRPHTASEPAELPVCGDSDIWVARQFPENLNDSVVPEIPNPVREHGAIRTQAAIPNQSNQALEMFRPCEAIDRNRQCLADLDIRLPPKQLNKLGPPRSSCRRH
jgi:hypothetical protein